MPIVINKELTKYIPSEMCKDDNKNIKHTYKETSTSLVFPNSCQGPLVVS